MLTLSEEVIDSPTPSYPTSHHENEVEEFTLPPRHHQLLRLIGLGWTKRAAAREMGMSEAAVSEISNSPLFKVFLTEFKAELDRGVVVAQNKLIEAAPKAADELLSQLELEQFPRLRKEAAMEILKGAGAIKQEAKAGIIINISEEKLTLINQTLKELK